METVKAPRNTSALPTGAVLNVVSSTFGGLVNDWAQLREEVLSRLRNHRRLLAEPVRVTGEELQISEDMMVPETPYVVRYQGEMLEFVRKLDGSLVISQLVAE